MRNAGSYKVHALAPPRSVAPSAALERQPRCSCQDDRRSSITPPVGACIFRKVTMTTGGTPDRRHVSIRAAASPGMEPSGGMNGRRNPYPRGIGWEPAGRSPTNWRRSEHVVRSTAARIAKTGSLGSSALLRSRAQVQEHSADRQCVDGGAAARDAHEGRARIFGIESKSGNRRPKAWMHLAPKSANVPPEHSR